MKSIRVLNVDDSAFMRRLLKDIFTADEDFSYIAQASNGKEALDVLLKEDFDVITLDIEMPVMNGIEALKEIMVKKPVPVVMISSASEKYANITMDALELGAVDFIAKPSNIFAIESHELDQIRNTVKSAASSNRAILINKNRASRRRALTGQEESDTSKFTISQRQSTFTSFRGRTQTKIDNEAKKDETPKLERSYLSRQATKTEESKVPDDPQKENVENIIVIGTSTGGPRALQEVIPGISPNIKASILIVQHMPKGFTKSLAVRLNAMSDIEVDEAVDGKIIKNGCAYIAPGGKHLKIEDAGRNRFKIVIDDSESIGGHKPSVDTMFDSVTRTDVKNVIAVIMTGMGSDGSQGMSHIKDKKKSYTIAEDESTCVVYGMPKSAVQTGKVDKVVPLNRISEEINKKMGV